MAYLSIGGSVMVSEKRIIGIFDLDNTSQSKITRQFLNRAQKDGVVLDTCEDLPKSFLVCDQPYHAQIIYLSQLNSSTLQKRINSKGDTQ